MNSLTHAEGKIEEFYQNNIMGLLLWESWEAGGREVPVETPDGRNKALL